MSSKPSHAVTSLAAKMTPSSFSRLLFLLLLLLQHHHNPTTALPSPNSSNATSNGSDLSNEGFVLPLYHKSHPKVAHYFSSTNGPIAATTNTTTVAAAAAAVDVDADGLIKFKDVEYMLEFSLGIPPMLTYGVFDTGSDLLWVQSTLCQQKRDCFKQDKPLYDPTRSQSFIRIPCDNWICKQEPHRFFCQPYKVCGYKIQYVDSTSSTGILAKDALGITVDERLHGGILFGAAQTDTLPSAWSGHGPPGIVGFSSKGYSIVAQLGIKSFSHCFPQDNSLVSHIRFNQKADLLGPGTETTGDDSVDIGKYFISFTGMRFNGHAPQMPATTILVDTGTQYTHLKPSVYQVLMNGLRAEINHKPAIGVSSTFPVCYKHDAADDLKKLALTFVFKEVEMPLSFQNAWTTVKMNYFLIFKKRYLCLTVLKRGNERYNNILGHYQMKDMNIGYDLESEKVHLSPDNCADRAKRL
ncbi:hypothetical protein Ancab_002307 [Ancistrocladus abbreviatus]